MIDWKGLLKFSLQYADGTKQSNFKQMSKQDKQWLEGAINQYSNAQIKQIHKILLFLQQYIQKDKQQQVQEQILTLLAQLQDLLQSLDRGQILFKLNGHIILLKIIFYSPFISNRILSLQIMSSICQNDAQIQTQAINSGAMQLVEIILKQSSMKVKQAMMSLISAMLRGQNLQAKRIFINIKGFQLIKEISDDQKTSKKLFHKCFILLQDFLYYDNKLHKTYNDLSQFSNTAGLKLSKQHLQNKKKEGLTYDANKQFQKQNELQKNKLFKGITVQFLHKNPQLHNKYKSWQKQQQQQK